MKELTMNEVNQVAGASAFGAFMDVVMMGSTGFICAAASVKSLSGVVLPYVGQVAPQVYAVAGFIAGASIVYSVTNHATNN